MKKIMCLAASALMLLSGCGKKTADNRVQASRDVFAMDTYMNLKAYGENAEDALLFVLLKVCKLQQFHRLLTLILYRLTNLKHFP